MGKWRKAFRSRLQGALLSVLLVLVLLNYGALIYLRDELSTRDYSMIPDPRNRVGYCMLTSMTLADKYLLAETTAHPPDFGIFSAVMSVPGQGLSRQEMKIAISALKNRDDLRARAHRVSHEAAAGCGYWQIKWPSGITPLDIHLKWLKFDSTYSRFVERIRLDPDAAERIGIELSRRAKNQLRGGPPKHS